MMNTTTNLTFGSQLPAESYKGGLNGKLSGVGSRYFACRTCWLPGRWPSSGTPKRWSDLLPGKALRQS